MKRALKINKESTKKDIFLVLHNIRSAYNIGSIMRTADAAGVSKIYLSGYTPTPIDRFGRVQKKIQKTALGAHESVPWEHVASARSAIDKLKREGVFVIAVEQDKKAVDYRKLKSKHSIAYVFGNEVRGLSRQIILRCDAISVIPMHGKKESLNVAVAAGIILFRSSLIKGNSVV